MAASTVTGAHRASTGRLATASSVGTTLEWYDFTVYNTLAALVFNRLFFPSFDPMSGTILAFSTYAVGYLSRPLGGVVFGHLGDKRGRRFVLVLTLVPMGMGSGREASDIHYNVVDDAGPGAYCVYLPRAAVHSGTGAGAAPRPSKTICPVRYPIP